MESVFIKVAAFVTIICAGYLAGRSGKLGSNPGGLVSKIVFNFTLPCAVIHAFGGADFTYDLLLLFVVGVVFNFASYFAMMALVRGADRADRVFYLCNICGYNIGCFALPFVQAFFPPAQAVATCLFDAGNAIMMSGGTYALTSVVAGEERPEHPVRLVAKRLFSSVTVDIYLLLVALAVLGIKIPAGIVEFTEPMANANAFLAMFMLGLMTNLHVDASKLGRAAKLLAARVVFSVLFTLIALYALPFSMGVRIVICMVVWAPVGSMGPVFTLWCKGDHGLAGFVNAVTIIMSIVAMLVILTMTGAAV